MIETAKKYLSKMPPAISGSGGHNATYTAACKCVELGLNEAETWEAMREYNQRCQPPWSEKELGHKIADAYRRAKPMSNTYQKRSSGFIPPSKPTKFAPRRPSILRQSSQPSQIIREEYAMMDYTETATPLILEDEDGYVFDLDFIAEAEAEAGAFADVDV